MKKIITLCILLGSIASFASDFQLNCKDGYVEFWDVVGNINFEEEGIIEIPGDDDAKVLAHSKTYFFMMTNKNSQLSILLMKEGFVVGDVSYSLLDGNKVNVRFNEDDLTGVEIADCKIEKK